MTTLEDLARSLGGVIQFTNGEPWLDTHIGELRAIVIRRYRPFSESLVYDIAVFMADSRELDPLHPTAAWWWLEERLIPRLGHGYVFTGCRGGVLHACAVAPASFEHVVGALWELARWARLPWRAPSPYKRPSRWSQIRRFLGRPVVIAVLVLLVMLVK